VGREEVAEPVELAFAGELLGGDAGEAQPDAEGTAAGDAASGRDDIRLEVASHLGPRLARVDVRAVRQVRPAGGVESHGRSASCRPGSLRHVAGAYESGCAAR